jgi:hypothetical protein
VKLVLQWSLNALASKPYSFWKIHFQLLLFPMPVFYKIVAFGSFVVRASTTFSISLYACCNAVFFPISLHHRSISLAEESSFFFAMSIINCGRVVHKLMHLLSGPGAVLIYLATSSKIALFLGGHHIQD